ncbi:unnamed protein product [Chrysodeixis includens]|uniref:Protein GUCD1 n=1 Tax=Chrysodeixis includens TaxID=689277 RepID=A0A9N8Q2E2_CHRIL|nr:unnamed protein product [Chrysodeixis includens]
MAAQDEQALEHRVEHFRQRYNWDCGVSCVLMLLSPAQREEMLDKFEGICRDEGFNQSTWTIDLCYLLKRFGIKHRMFTITLGVNEDYSRQGYYDRIIHLDRERVKRRFLEAASCGIQVRRAALSAAQLAAHVRARGPALLLVDAGLLVCRLCKHNKLKAEFRRCFGGSYSGHYIVVVGSRGGWFLYRDPALSPRLCAAAPAQLRRASTAPGTDHDVILIDHDYR